MQDVNLRQVFEAFCEIYAPARELMAGGTPLGELKGAPLRCSLDGALYSRPGMLATGEAIGSTYDFSGEGIGKAMQTGMLAASRLAKGRDQQLGDAARARRLRGRDSRAAAALRAVPQGQPRQRATPGWPTW